MMHLFIQVKNDPEINYEGQYAAETMQFIGAKTTRRAETATYAMLDVPLFILNDGRCSF
jgi:hypothetical protein